MLSPVKFVVAFKTAGGEGKTAKSLRQSTERGDLKVFLSSTHKEPSEQNNEKVCTNVSYQAYMRCSKDDFTSRLTTNRAGSWQMTLST